MATDVEERALADSKFGSGTPATWYVGLSTTIPGDDGANFTEPSGGSYARSAKTNNQTNWPGATTTSGVTIKINGTAVVFPNPTGDWGEIVAFGFFEAASGGTAKYVFELDQPTRVRSGNTPVEFPIGLLATRWE